MPDFPHDESGLTKWSARSRMLALSPNVSPARTGRQGQWAQENPECPQAPPLEGAVPPPPLEPTRTPTEEKLRSVLLDPHSGQSGLWLSAYSDMVMRTSKAFPQSGHL